MKDSGETMDATPMAETTIVCVMCGESFVGFMVEIAGRRLTNGRVCPACTSGAAEREKHEAHERAVKKKKDRWLKLCPDYYRTEGIMEAMKVQRASGLAIEAHVKEGRGVLAQGDTGAFKTTCMLHYAVKRLVWIGADVIIITAMAWKQRMSRHAREGSIEGAVREYCRVPWLYLDDLGNMAGTPASEEALHLLTEMRVQRGLPMLVTSQYHSDELIAQFKSTKQGEAVARRLRLLGEPVHFPPIPK